MAQIHEYPVQVEWKGGRGGAGKVKSKHSGIENAINVPPEFQGPGGGASPEELLTSAITACYTITFGIIAENRKLPVTDVKTDAVGEVTQDGAQFTYTKVTIRPTITVSADATDDQMKMTEEMAHKADMYCIVTNAVRGKVEIAVEPNIVRG